MNPELEGIIMSIILASGACRSSAMEAIALAKEGKMEEADAAIETANKEILEAHHVQTDLIRKEAGGNKVEISLLMVHAQDHLMTSIAVKDLATEFVDLYKRIK